MYKNNIASTESMHSREKSHRQDFESLKVMRAGYAHGTCLIYVFAVAHFKNGSRKWCRAAAYCSFSVVREELVWTGKSCDRR